MQTIEGRNYARGIRLHKQSFCALLKWRLQNIYPTDEQLEEYIGNLRLETTEENLHKLMQLKSFEKFCSELLKVGDGTQARMI